MASNRTEWLEERRKGLGASDAAAILGVSRWQSALSVYTEKLGLGPAELDEPDWLYWGRALEPVIAARYHKETQRQLCDPGDFEIFRCAAHRFMCCTPDRLILDTESDVAGVLEIKTGAAFKESEWLDEPPIEYQVQMQHSLVVLGLDWGSFAVLFGGQRFFWCDVQKNDGFCEYLIRKEEQFWRHVENHEPPPVGDPAESAHEALERLYPKDSGATIELPGALIAVADELEELKRYAAKTKKEITGLENKIRAAMGDAAYGVLPNGGQFSLKTVARAGFTVEPTEFRQLRWKAAK